MNISKKNGKGAVGKTGSKRTAAKRVEEDVHDYFRDDGDDDDSEDEIDGEEEGEEPSLDAFPYHEELAMCSPAMRELEEDVAEDMAGYMEERI